MNWSTTSRFMKLEGCEKGIKTFFRVENTQRVKPDKRTDKTAKIIFECEGNALLMQMFLERSLGYRLERILGDWYKEYRSINSKLTYKLIEEEN